MDNKNRKLQRQLIKFFDDTKSSQMEELIENANRVMSYYRCAILEIETKFKVLNEQFSLRKERNPIEAIKSRVKSFESIREKLARKALPITFESIEENLSDVAGVRVICSFTDDVYTLAQALLNQDDIKLIEQKDYIKNPKPNGYRSLHLIVEIPIFLCDEKKFVRVEVQLRTIAMELWANLEHRMRYKKNLSDDVLEKTSDMLFECAEISAGLDHKMQEIRNIIETD